MAGQENVYGGGLGGGNTKNGLGGAKEGVDGNAKENVQANVKEIAEGNTHDGGQGRDSESLQPGDGLVKERTPSPVSLHCESLVTFLLTFKERH